MYWQGLHYNHYSILYSLIVILQSLESHSVSVELVVLVASRRSSSVVFGTGKVDESNAKSSDFNMWIAKGPQRKVGL